MFPIKDNIRSHTFPVVNWILIIANAIVFVFELNLSPSGLEQFVMDFGLVPSRLDILQPLSWMPVFTHMFLHGGWFHFLSNMWMLFIFGDNVEDRLGSGRFLFFYLTGGLASGLIQAFFTAQSDLPSIGASGAIAAVLGAYFLFFPRARVITFIPILIIPWFTNLPAVIFLGFWFVSQIFSGLAALATTSGMAVGGVAWWAHIGGFVVGLLLGKLLDIRRSPSRWYPDEYYPY